MMESSCVIKTVDDPQQQKSGFMDIRALTETNEVRSNTLHDPNTDNSEYHLYFHNIASTFNKRVK